MPLDNTIMAAALTTNDAMKLHRLEVAFRRVTKRNVNGIPVAWVAEKINIVHPDDPGQDKRKSFNSFRELGSMFKGNSDYVDVTYTKYEAVAQWRNIECL